MNTVYRPAFVSNPITINALRDYILDTDLTDVDTILLHPVDFDELALDYRNTYDEHIPDIYLLLGVLIQADTRRSARPNTVTIVENDTESIRVKQPERVDPNRVIYRCETCGSLVDAQGYELDSVAHKLNADYLNKFGEQATEEHVTGYCCQNMQQSERESKPRYDSMGDILRKIDYSVIEGKPLMELTADDFKQIKLYKRQTPEFEIIYSCQDSHSVKIYFTPNESSYSLRGYMLKEEEQITTTEQLIKAVRDWRKP